MAILVNQLNPQSKEFKNNAAAMQALVNELRSKVSDITQGGGEAARQRHQQQGNTILHPG